MHNPHDDEQRSQHETETDAEYQARMEGVLDRHRESGEETIEALAARVMASDAERDQYDADMHASQLPPSAFLPHEGDPVEGQITVTSDQVKGDEVDHVVDHVVDHDVDVTVYPSGAMPPIPIKGLEDQELRAMAKIADRAVSAALSAALLKPAHDAGDRAAAQALAEAKADKPIKGLRDQPFSAIEPARPPIKMAPVVITVSDSVHIDDVPRRSLTRKWDAAALAEKARRR